MKKPSLRVRELYWRKRVQFYRRQEAKPNTHRVRQQWRDKRRLAEARLAKVRRQIAATRVPLRLRALKQAERLLGVMEQGANNRGSAVEQIIRGGGGLPGQAWCGWFCAYVYRLAGSKAVVWQWGAVRLLWPLAGISRTANPKPGDLVRFTFSHVGLFVKDLGGGMIETIEGNTGASGAVSDSTTGGDGVYRKKRPKFLVKDYLHVSK